MFKCKIPDPVHLMGVLCHTQKMKGKLKTIYWQSIQYMALESIWCHRCLVYGMQTDNSVQYSKGVISFSSWHCRNLQWEFLKHHKQLWADGFVFYDKTHGEKRKFNLSRNIQSISDIMRQSITAGCKQNYLIFNPQNGLFWRIGIYSDRILNQNTIILSDKKYPTIDIYITSPLFYQAV
jgi:hypothetical protein